jgi:UrcA family protein
MPIRFALVAFFFIVFPVSASAQPWREAESRSLRVDVSALDLSTLTGMTELERRIARAVNRICDSDPVCRDEAWTSTEDQVARAIDRDRWMRRMAEERIAQLDACGGQACVPAQPAYYPPPPAAGVTVVVIHNPAPTIYRY